MTILSVPGGGTINATVLRQGASMLAYQAAVAQNLFWVSNDGDDANSGSRALPFETLAEAETHVVAGTKIVLADGDVWKEDIQSTADNVQVRSLGLATIDGSDIITGWTQNATYTNVWEKTVTMEGNATERTRVYEDDTLLATVADVATCNSTAGSFVYHRYAAGATFTLQVHATGSGNPNTNGKVYEAALRRRGIYLTGDDCTVEGMVVGRCVANNGSIELGDPTTTTGRATVTRSIAYDGSKHNMLISSGDVTDTIAVRADPGSTHEPVDTMFVTFRNDQSGSVITYTRCGAVWDSTFNNNLVSAHYMHDVAGNWATSFTGTQIWSIGTYQGWLVSSNANNITGYYAKNTDLVFDAFYKNTTIKGFLDNYQKGNARGRNNVTINSGETLLVENYCMYDLGSNNVFFHTRTNLDGATVHFKNCVFYRDNSGKFGQIFGYATGTVWTSGNLIFENCIFVYAATATGFFEVPTGVTYTGSGNVFISPSPTSAWKYNGTNYSSLAAWQAATGEDLDSLYYSNTALANIFNGTVANGDFTIKSGTTEGDAVIALGAGAVEHFDWDAGAMATGAPTAWPVVPETLSDSLVYAADPTAWSWS